MACSQPISITSIKPVSWNRAAILSSGWATTKPNWHVKPAIEKSCINYKAGDVLPGMNAGASLSAVPSPIEGSGTAWVLLGSWALSPARPTPIPPRHECRGFSALLGELPFGDEGGHRFGPLVIQGHGDNHEPLILKCLVQLIHIGHFPVARATPGSPEVQQDNL